VGYSEVRTGASLTTGFPLGRFTRIFPTYTYEVIDTAGLSSLINTSASGIPTANGVPIFAPFLDDGRHVESRIGPSLVYNTVDNPYTPRRGARLTASTIFAGGPLGGGINYVRPDAEGVLYVPHLRKTALGLRAEVAWIAPYGHGERLPYYQ